MPLGTSSRPIRQGVQNSGTKKRKVCFNLLRDLLVKFLPQFRLKGAQQELDVVLAQLKEKQDKLATIEAKVHINLHPLYKFTFTISILYLFHCRLRTYRPAMSAVLVRNKSYQRTWPRLRPDCNEQPSSPQD